MNPSRELTSPAGSAVSVCPLCLGKCLHYQFSVMDHRVVRCGGCGLLLGDPRGTVAARSALPSGTDRKPGRAVDASAPARRASADGRLDLLARYRGPGANAQLLEVGCGAGDFLLRAAVRGYRVTGLDRSAAACAEARRSLGAEARIVCGEVADLANTPAEQGRYDVVALPGIIEHVPDPRHFLKDVHRLLRPGGVILVITPSLDSWAARLRRNRWAEFKPEHLSYFNRSTLHSLLFHCGFEGVVHQPGGALLADPDAAADGGPSGRWTHRLVPASLRRRSALMAASDMMMLARAATVPERRKLSVVVPIYNEAPTVETALDRLLAKEVEGLHTEFILVESNSTDGTREIVQRYAGRPGVRVVLEDRPRGKGHAVRAGFQHATGDFVLIQDADLEYDLEDYEQLLEPLRAGWNAFILGARHGGRAWKMRQFNDQPLVAAALNGAHRFFTGLFNVVFGLRLKDPFTMYKVFRRDCLHGLEFECDRFDFDLELLFRLVQAGHRPVEVPVNYRSRSFKEGKKVSVWRDPLTWLRAALRCRLSPPDPLAAVERARTAGTATGLSANGLPAGMSATPAPTLFAASAR